MTSRQRIALLSVIAAIALAVAAVFGALAYQRSRAEAAAPDSVDTRPAAAFTGDRVEFRNTAVGQSYGLVASVPLDAPAGPRTLSSQVCDRVYSTSSLTMCLHTEAGIVTTWGAEQTGAHAQSWPLPGVPSRTRISADSRLVATTAFITGESYASVGFSTQTIIASADGTLHGDLEDFALLIDGVRTTAADRNIWGVTFGDDDRTFYATAATAGSTWLVRGDLETRTLTSVRQTAECPSLSPDGTRVAYKKNAGSFTAPDWHIAVLDLATMTETVLPETRSVDDQVEWLDDDSLLYGLPHEDAIGDSDVWRIAADGASDPQLFIPHAWSPSVVRG